MNPSIAVTVAGRPVIAATLSGPQYFPTPVYITADGSVHIATPSTATEDGFSGYIPGFGYGDFVYYYPFDPEGVARWGAYSAAVADSDGTIWTAVESIAMKRSSWANWGTAIGHVTFAP